MCERSRIGREFQVQPDEFQRKVGALISEFRGENSKKSSSSSYVGSISSTMRIGEVVSRLLVYSHEHRVVLETNFVNVAVSLAVMDGLGRQLHEDFNIFRHATPYLAKAG